MKTNKLTVSRLILADELDNVITELGVDDPSAKLIVITVEPNEVKYAKSKDLGRLELVGALYSVLQKVEFGG